MRTFLKILKPILILQNIDIDEISYWWGFGILSTPGPIPQYLKLLISGTPKYLQALNVWKPQYSTPYVLDTFMACSWVIPCEMGQFWTVRLENQFFGPKQASYTPWGASGPNLAFASHLGVFFAPGWVLGSLRHPKYQISFWSNFSWFCWPFCI